MRLLPVSPKFFRNDDVAAETVQVTASVKLALPYAILHTVLTSS